MADALTIRRAVAAESEAVARVIRDAFATVAAQIGMDIPPVHESAADLQETFDTGMAVLVAEMGGEVVGTVRAEALPNDGIMVRRLAVLPDARGRGVARALMLGLEREYPDASRFELFTGANAVGPLALYESLGYRLVEPRQDHGFPLVWLEKLCD